MVSRSFTAYPRPSLAAGSVRAAAPAEAVRLAQRAAVHGACAEIREFRHGWVCVSRVRRCMSFVVFLH